MPGCSNKYGIQSSLSVKKSKPIKVRLANGLTILLKEMHAAPVTTLNVWYRVGSRNEHPGITGISHWVEHMMFKGTPSFNEAEMDRLITREGGQRNAFTWIDFTCYYETMPADKIDLAIEIEADRMVNTQFRKREVESERTVIINERQMYENGPSFRLSEEVQAAAFKVHPYGHEVIGHECDLHSMTRDALAAHYATYYSPANAVICVAGAFDAADMLAKLRRAFGKHKAGPKAPPVTAVEPVQKGERRVTVRGEGSTNYLTMAFAAPPATHADFFALVALDSVLCGASGLSFFGGGTSNRSSRLSKALVDTGLSADIGGGVAPTIDAHLYSLSATVMPGKTVSEVETTLWDQIELVKKSGITRSELDKAIKQTRAQFAFGTETVTNQAFWLGFCEMFADYTWFDKYMPHLQRVTLADVQRVANQILNRDHVTVGLYVAEANHG